MDAEPGGETRQKGKANMYNTFTGGYEYYIVMTGRNHAVKRGWEGSDNEPETMYEGSYAGCVTYIRNVFAANYEHDNDL